MLLLRLCSSLKPDVWEAQSSLDRLFTEPSLIFKSFMYSPSDLLVQDHFIKARIQDLQALIQDGRATANSRARHLDEIKQIREDFGLGVFLQLRGAH